MGYGPTKNGKQKPITPWQGSWAEQMSQSRTPDKSSVTCPHRLGLNCLKCYPVQYGRTNARMP